MGTKALLVGALAVAILVSCDRSPARRGAVNDDGGAPGVTGSTGGAPPGTGSAPSGGSIGAAGSHGGATGGVGGAGAPANGGEGGASSTGTDGGASDTSLAGAPRFLILPASLPPIVPGGALATDVHEDSIGVVAASPDGTQLVGTIIHTWPATGTSLAYPYQTRQLFTWNEASGMVALGTPPGVDPTQLRMVFVNSDGTTIVADIGALTGVTEGFARWTKGAGWEHFPFSAAVQASWDFFSDDGKTIAGHLFPPARGIPVRWTERTGLVPLTSVAGWPADAEITGLSRNGTLAGARINSPLSSAFLWSEADGARDLGTLPGTTYCSVNQFTADASVVVGACLGPRPGTYQVFRWTAVNGIAAIALLPATNFTYQLSGDGSVVMTSPPQSFSTPLAASINHALARWSASSPRLVDLPPPAGGVADATYTLTGMTNDGQVAYGGYLPNDRLYNLPGDVGTEAFTWTLSDGYSRLDLLPGYNFSEILSASRDGLVYAGRSGVAPVSPLLEEAVIWDHRGMRSVGAELIAGGIEMKNFHLSRAYRVWSGSMIFVQGTGVTMSAMSATSGSKSAWVAWLPLRP